MRTHEVYRSLQYLYYTAVRATFNETIESFEIPYDWTSTGGLEALAMELF